MKSSALRTVLSIVALFLFHYSLATVYFVSPDGDDGLGDGSVANPWRSLRHAVGQVMAGQGHTIRLDSGTFVENGLVEVPPGVNIEGAGHSTTLKADSSFYYHPANPGYGTDKFLIRLSSLRSTNGNQSLKNFSINGGSKQLHGGIFVHNRNNILIDGVKVEYTNFTGIWLWNSKDSRIINSELFNCSWGSTAYSAGALNLGNVERVEIARLQLDEDTGYGIKAIGPDSINRIVDLVIHDSRISVNPVGLWNNGQAPNFAIELWQVDLTRCEIYNCYVDNAISLVNSLALPSTGIRTMRLHHNTFDIETRAKGEGYGLELSIHDAEVDHNYFIKGRYGIANWHEAMRNWDIHHNIFYAIEGPYPGDIVRSQVNGLHNVRFYNNTIEFASDKTMNVIGVYGGRCENVEVINNLFINNNTAYNYYTNSLLHLEGDAIVTNVSVKNNFFDSLNIGNVPGATYTNNLTGNPHINKIRSRPDPYYRPKAGSPLIDAGINISLHDESSSPDIGAYEYRRASLSANELDAASFDKTSNFDNIVVMEGQNSMGFTSHGDEMAVFPNAVKDKITIRYVSPASQEARISIIDSAATVVKETSVMVDEGSNKIVLETEGMVNGTYYLRFQTADETKLVFRIILLR